MALPFGTIGNTHEYEIQWRPDRVAWLVDGATVRSVTARLPSGPAAIYANIWGRRAGLGGSFLQRNPPRDDACGGFPVARMAVTAINVHAAP